MSECAPMKASWEDEYPISFYEVDTKNEAFLPVLWSFMQETAWHHADHLRLGYSDLMEQQYFWVLSRLSVRMEEYPRWGERIRVKTWLAGTGRLFALRQFSIADLSGRTLGTAKSAWLVLDLKSRKPRKIEPLFSHLQQLFDPRLPAEEPEKLPAPVRTRWKKSYEVRYSDIDIHHHVNNIKYIEWILDSYPLEINRTHHLYAFDINFLAEASYEDVLSVQTEMLQESPPTFLHDVFREGDNKELCRARAEWKRVNPSRPASFPLEGGRSG
jgi:acyl-ACP thioesterase